MKQELGNVMRLDPLDNIAVALRDLKKGTEINAFGKLIIVRNDIPQKHKFALDDLQIGDQIFMYGVLVGRAKTPIFSGGIVSTHNTLHAVSTFEKRMNDYSWSIPDVSEYMGLTFEGFYRDDGKVGTANYWLVVPLVFCENKNIELLENVFCETLGYYPKGDSLIDIRALIELYQQGASTDDIYKTPLTREEQGLRKPRVFENVDGIKFIKHNGGCGGTREDSEVLCKLLAGYILNPNVAGATVLSLGCQNAQIELLKKAIRELDPKFAKPLFILEQQRFESERAFIEKAVKDTFVGLMEANKAIRRPAPIKKLVIGLECGGSDGFSGISANPVLGYTADIINALEGSTVLAEFPELHGVEQHIMNRCVHESDARRFADLMKKYESAVRVSNSGFESNPSPGNIKDGLITHSMKSAGAYKKAGTAPITAVLDYTEQVTEPGLNLLCTPGNDVESTTGLAGSGCNLIVFTTGLGTPTGNPIAPVIKVSSNSRLYNQMPETIDFNAGLVIDGVKSIRTMGEELLGLLIAVASGERNTKAMINRQDDFIPWKRGISL